MMRMKYLVLSALALVTMTACADFQLKTREDIRNSEKQDKKPASTTSAPQATQAATPVVEKEDLDTQMRNLNGRVDEAENQVKQMALVAAAEKEEAKKLNEAREQKINALEEEVKKLEAQVQALTEQVNKKPVVPADPTSYITEGDELTAAKKHKEAIVAYQKYRDAQPKGGRYAEATYKIGVSFQDLGMKDESRAFYEEVIGKFPKSPFAKNAAKKLKTIK